MKVQIQSHSPQVLGDVEKKLSLSVLFTSFDATRKALRAASQLAADLSAGITLVVPVIVPYPLPLNHPPVSRAFNERRFAALVSSSCGDCPAAAVHLYLCRSWEQALDEALEPRSIVLIGRERLRLFWWLSRGFTAACCLRRRGHEVVVA